jgi:hypothetical protein
MMAVLRKRNRLVSFRVSEQEYEVLQNVIVTEGARSISDFARGILYEVLDGNGNGIRVTASLPPKSPNVNHAIEQLNSTMGELNRVITKLSILVENTSPRAEQN